MRNAQKIIAGYEKRTKIHYVIGIVSILYSYFYRILNLSNQLIFIFSIPMTRLFYTRLNVKRETEASAALNSNQFSSVARQVAFPPAPPFSLSSFLRVL